MVVKLSAFHRKIVSAAFLSPTVWLTSVCTVWQIRVLVRQSSQGELEGVSENGTAPAVSSRPSSLSVTEAGALDLDAHPHKVAGTI